MESHDLLRSETEVDLARQIRHHGPKIRALAAELDAMSDLKARRDAVKKLYALCFDAGLHQVEASTKAGGYALGFGPRLVLFEELSRADAGVAMVMLATSNVVARAEHTANAQVRKRIIEPCMKDTSGAWLLSTPATEPQRGSDAMNFVHDASLEAQARPVSGGYEITGTKWMMTNCGTAAAYQVAVQLGPSRGFAGRAYAFVEASSEGVSAEPVEKRGLRTAFHGTLRLQKVRVPKALVLIGPKLKPEVVREQNSTAIAAHVLEIGTLSVGVAQAALDVVTEHSRKREQSGRKLIEHQAVALRLAEISQAVAAARALMRDGAMLADAGQLDLAAAARARAAAIEASRLAYTRGLDLIGSPGVLESHPLGKLSRDAETLAVPIASPDLLRILGTSSLSPRGGRGPG
jgi:alkylation response protein AidB-like acyl-CoA dehydrogenase